METPDHRASPRRLLGAALLAGVGTAVVQVAFVLARRAAAGPMRVDPSAVLVEGVGSLTVGAVPFILAVLFLIARPTRRIAVGGAVLVYVVALLGLVWGLFRVDSAELIEPPILAIPLVAVVSFLAVATAVWLAYLGGYDRLVSAVGPIDQHPVLAPLAAKPIGPSLTLHRAVLVVAIAASVGVGGHLLAGTIADLLGWMTTAGPSQQSPPGAIWSGIGVSPGRLPTTWLIEASFVLAVLFVTGPRLRLRDVGKAIAVVYVVQATVAVLPALRNPTTPVALWARTGPIVGPFDDTALVLGLAVAVWLAFHRAAGPHDSRLPSEQVPD